MKIFDCFTFFNEFELLQIRLEELYDFVDYFVLVESTIKHSGELKPLYYKENKKIFSKWSKKIIHIIIEDAPTPGFSLSPLYNLDARWGLGRWKTERHQRNQIRRGLINCNDDDIIIVSDIDEIPNRTFFNEMKDKILIHGYVVFNQKLYYYFLNGYVEQKNWRGTVACDYRFFKKAFNGKADNVRRLDNFKIRLLNKISIKTHPAINLGGWHFSYLGGVDIIIEKIKSLSHSENLKEDSFLVKERISSLLKTGDDIYGRQDYKITYIQIDESFPRTIKNNINKYKHLIKNLDF